MSNQPEQSEKTPPSTQPSKPKNNKKRNLIITGVVIGLLIICGIIGALSGNSSDKNSTTQKIENTQVVIKETEIPTNPPEPTATLEPKDALKAEIESVLGAGNRDIPRLTTLNFDDPEKGAIFINWAINDNLTENMIRSGAKFDATHILKALAQSGIDYTYVIMSGSFSMADKFGNTSEENEVNLTFEKSTVDKINWENFISDNIYDIADVAAVYPAFRDQ